MSNGLSGYSKKVHRLISAEIQCQFSFSDSLLKNLDHEKIDSKDSDFVKMTLLVRFNHHELYD